MKISIVFLDDEIELGKVFSAFFATNEVEVLSFSDPESAISAVWEKDPDAIFLDYRMEQCTGDDVAEELPEDIPKYLLTGELDLKPRVKYEMILEKPYDIAAIQMVVDQLIANKRAFLAKKVS